MAFITLLQIARMIKKRSWSYDQSRHQFNPKENSKQFVLKGWGVIASPFILHKLVGIHRDSNADPH